MPSSLVVASKAIPIDTVAALGRMKHVVSRAATAHQSQPVHDGCSSHYVDDVNEHGGDFVD